MRSPGSESGEKPRFPSESVRLNAKFIVCLAPSVTVTLATLVSNPSAETETS